MTDADDFDPPTPEEREALRLSLRNRNTAGQLIRDAIADIRRDYSPAFAIRVTPKLERALGLIGESKENFRGAKTKKEVRAKSKV